MNVELAKTAGFCFGVKRAVDTVYKQIEKHQSEKIFTYGPIIHNEEVIKDLRSHGVEVLNDEEELKTVDADVVVIRSHGVAKYIYDIMDERGITCVDATCPFVKKIHKIVAEESAKGSYIVIIGNGEHPEVEGIRGWARVDAMVVIGDKRSSNTQKLFEICKEECLNTYYIQTLDDLDINQLRSVESVGITAGASTPNKIIEEVQNNVRINF